MKKLLIASLLIILVSAGCGTISQPRYPLDWPEKRSSTDQCPDISGIYYERASKTYSATQDDQKDADHLCRLVADSSPHWPFDRGKYTHSVCSLWNLFDEDYYSPYVTRQGIPVTDELCTLREVEIQQDGSSLNIAIREDGKILKKLSTDLNELGFYCDSGEFVYEKNPEHKYSVKNSISMFPGEDNSLIIIKFLSKQHIRQSYRIFKWDRLGSSINPYENCE
jgi:hypothetical protein